jgi:hypothetical protein
MMKLGTKSNLISAYTALFTVAFGILIFDYVRRAAHHSAEPVAVANHAPARPEAAKPGHLAAR